MDRRTFNKALSGLFAGALLPISEPLVATVVGTAAPSHFGLTHFGLTTSFTLDPIMGNGKLEPFIDIDEEPIIEGEFAFYTDEERTEEKTVFFEGKSKKWDVVADPKPEPNDQTNVLEGEGQQGRVIEDNSHSPSGVFILYVQRVYYEMKSVEVFLPNDGDQVNLTDIQKGKRYDIVLKFSTDSETVSVTMRDASIKDIVIVPVLLW